MKWLVVAGTAVVLVTLWAGIDTAQSQGRSPEISALKRQVTALKAEVNALRKRVDAMDARTKKGLADLKTTIDDESAELNANFTGDGCILSSTADLFIATWSAIDRFTQETAARTVFGPQASFDDKGACGRLINPSVTRQTAVPPNFSTYNTLISWIRP